MIRGDIMAKKLPVGFREYKGGYQYRFVVEGKRYSVYGATVKECRAKELQKREEKKRQENGRGGSFPALSYYTTQPHRCHPHIR